MTSTTLQDLSPATEYVVMVTGHVVSEDEEIFQSPTGKDIETTGMNLTSIINNLILI